MSDRLKFVLSILFVAVIAGAIWGRSGSLAGQRLTFLSVGQGDCTVWQDGATTVLIDVGPKAREGFDAGDRIVLPKLRRMGVRSVSAIIITHPDADHIGGLEAVAKRFSDAKIVASAGFKDNEEMRWWLKEAEIDPGRIVWIEDRTRIKAESSTIELAAPPVLPDGNDNDGSLFVWIESGPATAVITGDASMATEEAMQRELKWMAQVLKVGHHGSRTSTSEAFVRAVGADWSVVSCGKENRFNHPHPSVLRVLERQKVGLFRTDLQGDVAFEWTEAGFKPLMKPISSSAE